MSTEPHDQRPRWKVGGEMLPRDPLPEDMTPGWRRSADAVGDWSSLSCAKTPKNYQFFPVGSASATQRGWDEREVQDLV